MSAAVCYFLVYFAEALIALRPALERAGLLPKGEKK